MIIAIGIDIIEVRRVSEALGRTPRFAERVFTPSERDYCQACGKMAAQHYAARFTAKEAALKAFQTGWSGSLSWQDVEVIRTESGAPALAFRNQALKLYQQCGATRSHLSISHTSEYAIAQVILET